MAADWCNRRTVRVRYTKTASGSSFPSCMPAARTCKREEHVSWSRAVSYHLIGLITFYRAEVVVLYDSVKIPRCRSRSRNMNDLSRSIFASSRWWIAQSSARLISLFSIVCGINRDQGHARDVRFLSRVSSRACRDLFVFRERKIPFGWSRFRADLANRFSLPFPGIAQREYFIVSCRFPWEPDVNTHFEEYTGGVCTFYDGTRTVSRTEFACLFFVLNTSHIRGIRDLPFVISPVFFWKYLQISTRIRFQKLDQHIAWFLKKYINDLCTMFSTTWGIIDCSINRRG